MKLAINISHQSSCVKKKVGAIISKNDKIISVGYNGPPYKTYNCIRSWPKEGCPRTEHGSCLYSIHAEHNAIYYAQKSNLCLKGAILYVTLSPCINCSKLIFFSGIQKVYYLNLYSKYKNFKNEDGLKFLEKFGVEAIHFK